ncbi:hypothetical protein SAMN02746062_01026 [Alysiella filiformis DSM 16848]|uniref:Uncharacterized protein n=1 Tax=Alysiella filiformis DSM 16848 TaxID=1120981 RepID=A0A286EAA3_9NEIS|nr:hypothetical protein [Alysiella filiformis]SOD67764.1 hypothetical protein SAMN02746062_01026 [Alysiella filiformis DSM 16848]
MIMMIGRLLKMPFEFQAAFHYPTKIKYRPQSLKYTSYSLSLWERAEERRESWHSVCFSLSPTLSQRRGDRWVASKNL